MHRLRLLGEIGLEDGDGRAVESLLRQPKHLALLAYLALPAPGTWHRRDVVLAMFWPELPQARARAALRSALYTLRRHLPGDAIRSRGADELSVDAALVATDVAAMQDDFAAGRYASALQRYRGDLLAGVYVADAAGFDEWLDDRRRELRAMARRSATRLADSLDGEGDVAGAIDAARRAAELDPDDETAARRWIALLDRAGDRAQALAAYERLRAHVRTAFDASPSAETMELLAAVRARCATASPAVRPSPASMVSSAPSPPAAPEPLAPREAPASRERRPARAVSRPRRLRAFLALPLVLALVGWASLHWRAALAAPMDPPSLLVLPMLNETGDAGLDYVATGIAEGVAKRLDDLGGLTVRSSARALQVDSARIDVRALARRVGLTTMLVTRVRRVGDSLEVRAAVVDTRTLQENALRPRRFALDGIRDAESRLAADVAGVVLRVPMPTVPRRPTRDIRPESYQLMLMGWHQLLSIPDGPGPPGSSTGRTIAGRLFQRAVDADNMNARAWSGLSSVAGWQAATDEVAFDDGYERATAHARRALALDSLEASAWGNLAYMRALHTGDADLGLALIRKAESAEPSNAEVLMIKQGILASAHRFDEARDAARMARQLDPVASVYFGHEGAAELCAGRPEAARELYATELVARPDDRTARRGLTRALASSGRYAEALASWRELARLDADTTLAAALAGARTRADYWRLRHAEGRARLAALDARARQGGRVSPLRVVQASFGSGDTVAGEAAVERALLLRTTALYRLPCMADMDEYRDTPLFRRLLARIGALRITR